ncbi:phosphatidylglycerol lysyltransferase domain-containing protein [Amnibacterium kyonggiense]
MTAWLKQRPASVGLAAALLVLAVATRSLLVGPDPQLAGAVGLDIEGLYEHGQVWRLITSVLFARGFDLPIALLGLLFGVGACERLIGTGRTLLAWAVTALAGGLVGTAAQAAGLLTRQYWTTPPATSIVLDPITPIVGVVMAASTFAGPLWRRRIRLVGFAALIVLLLYSGQPSDVNRLAAGVAGVVLGWVLGRRRPRLVFLRSSHHESRSLLAVVLAVSAIGPVVAIVQPTGYGLLRPFGRLFRDTLPGSGAFAEHCARIGAGPGCARELALARLNGPGALVLTVLPLLVALLAAFAIQRGRRVGAWLSIIVNGLLALFAAVYYGLFPVLGDPDQIADIRAQLTLQSVLAVLVPLALVVGVLVGRRHLTALPSRQAMLVAGLLFGGAVVASAVLYVGVGTLVRTQFRPVPSVVDLLLELPQRYVPVGFLRFRRLDFVPVGPMARLLEGWTGPIAWFALLVAGIVLTRSVADAMSERDQIRIRALLTLGARGSISWMATWPGNRYWFSADGRHGVAYREGSGVALTLGEPVGPDDGAMEAARAFAVHCDDIGLTPAFYSVRPEFAAGLGGPGAAWASIEVGEDTVIDPTSFSMKGKHWQDVRSSINRADRLGIRSVWTSWAELPLGWRAQIESISEEWVADKRLPELGFTLGGLDELVDREVRLMLAVGPGDRIEAVTSWLPTWRDGEIIGQTLDFMRRRPGSPNGVMEFVIAAVIAHAAARDTRFVSLSVAPLAGASPDAENRIERLLESLGRLLEPAYGFRSLAAYKQKFRPEHHPQVLAFADAVALPAISVAVARAYLPDITLPVLARMVGALRPDDEDGDEARLRELAAGSPRPADAPVQEEGR